MRYFLDTEFNENSAGVTLISIGIAAEDGRDLYCISSEFVDKHCNDWVKQNVLNQLTGPRIPNHEIAQKIKAFIMGDSLPDFWGYYADYDWYLFCRLFGGMLKLPAGWPNLCMDVKQLALHMGMPHINKIVPPPDDAHNALSDAKWTMEMYKKLVGFRVKQ
jgi:hypothetical protein